MKDLVALPCSFRDPSGFLFSHDSSIYRQVNAYYKENYDKLIGSGLYKSLVDSGLLIPHEEVDIRYSKTPEAYKVIKPEVISFISYPYEWCFSQLKSAALTTLQIQKRACEFGMSLKDSSAYNIQFRKGRPVFIDTLSFEKYEEGEPWKAYRQFCQHFLAPLALMSLKDVRLNQLLRIYIDGIPLDLASALLPFRTKFHFAFLSHIHMHAKSQKYFGTKPIKKPVRKMTRLQLLALIGNLESAVKKLKWQPQKTEWADYYEDTNYSLTALQRKKEIISDFLSEINPASVWDFGSNAGLFSRIASDRGIETIAFDVDPAAVEKNYLECIKKGDKNLLPLVLDLTNPSPGIGWQNKERASLFERGPVDTILALALIHHLAISNNLPFGRIAEFFHNICNSLIIEFVPKHDSQVQRLFSVREDIFTNYTQDFFEKEFRNYFTIRRSVKIKETERTLYLMEKRRDKK